MIYSGEKERKNQNSVVFFPAMFEFPVQRKTLWCGRRKNIQVTNSISFECLEQPDIFFALSLVFFLNNITCLKKHAKRLDDFDLNSLLKS